MKVLVTEIEKEELIEFLPIFGLDSQITILEEPPTPNNDGKKLSIKEPYYIDENIADLKRMISLGADADYGRTQIHLGKDQSKFRGFFELLLNINKQREMGYPIMDIEYIYKKGVQMNLPIALRRASVDLDFASDTDYFAIIGESEIGKMQLYQKDGDFSEFIFVMEYDKIKKFTKKKIHTTTHWHPIDYQAAIEDMLAFMNQDKEYFKKVGLKLK